MKFLRVGHSPVVGGILWKALKDVCHKVKRVNLLPGLEIDSTVKPFPNLQLKHLVPFVHQCIVYFNIQRDLSVFLIPNDQLLAKNQFC